MLQAEHFLQEAETLAGLIDNQPSNIFETTTLFKGWTVNDVIGHLYLFDKAAIKALRDDHLFHDFLSPVILGLNEGKSLLEIQGSVLGKLNGQALFKMWRKNAKALGQAYARADPKQRIKWVGPEMSALSCITARQMETWAHGQEIFDVLGQTRQEGDRIKNICHLGVMTYQWTFINRQLSVPAPVPFVQLIAPSGQIWEWNNPEADTSVKGSAVEFSQVVTQVRNVHDTKLETIGEPAALWMSLAQCFAGKPEMPPKEGSRFKA